MSLVTREEKGSKLTIAEMDGNLTYLESNGFVDGVYSQTVIGIGAIVGEFGGTIFFSNPIETGAIGTYTVTPTSGSGTGAQFELVVQEGGRGFIISANTSTIISGGSGYAEGDTLVVACSELGGTTGTVIFTLNEGSVDATTTSTITVTNSNITFETTTLNITGSIQTTGNIAANQGTFTSGVATSLIDVEQLLVLNLGGGDTVVKFTNLPNTDPVKLGQLWNDSGSLKISAGV